MKKVLQFTLVFLLVAPFVLSSGAPAYAQAPATAHAPTADTYIDSANPNINYGSNTVIGMSASNLAGCVTIRSLLFKFDVPATTSTIADATMSIVWRAGTSSNLPLALYSSADTSWVETTVTYNNDRPVLDAVPLATSPSVLAGGTVNFTGPTFAAYLNDHRGQTITLVVTANCSDPGDPVAVSANRSVETKESALGPDVYIEMYGPTAVELLDLSASTQPGLSATTLALVAALVAVPTLAWAGSRLIRRR